MESKLVNYTMDPADEGIIRSAECIYSIVRHSKYLLLKLNKTMKE